MRLTPRQIRIMKVVRDSLEARGFLPSYEELAKHVDCSRGVAHMEMRKLHEWGAYIVLSEDYQSPKEAVLSPGIYLPPSDPPTIFGPILSALPQSRPHRLRRIGGPSKLLKA